jgi:N-acetylglucosamine malate deacetylase 1
MPQKVLVLAPHPDDESIGCGGAILLHRRAGDSVHVAFLTSGEKGLPGCPKEEARRIREREAHQAGKTLGITALTFLRLPDLCLATVEATAAPALAHLLQEQAPDLVYLPHPEDAHPDHEATLPLVRSALALRVRRKKPPELRGYEVWGPMPRPGWVEVVDEVMTTKLRAIRRYRSQLAQFRYDDAIRGLNRYRGVLAGACRYAEAFQYLAPNP